MKRILSILLLLLTLSASSSAQNDKQYDVHGVKFTMKHIKGGSSVMGATKEMGEHDADELVHRITVDSFYLGETEVTQELWEAVMGKNPSKFRGENHPVEWISWDDCQKFIDKLNALTHQHFRLPTETEWEYAARGGCNSKHYRYAGSNSLDEVAWCSKNAHSLKKKHQPVRQKKPNELGLYDMTGNVSEWCQDYYVPYGTDPMQEPGNLARRKFRVIRGGCYNNTDYYLRVSNRNSFIHWRHDDNLGLRLAQ